MDGGVITIKFEADVKNIESALKNIEKTSASRSHIKLSADELEIKKITAEARRLNNEFKKSNPDVQRTAAEARKIRAEFNLAHPEVAQAKAEASLLRAQMQGAGKETGTWRDKVKELISDLRKAFSTIRSGFSQLSSGVKSFAKNIISALNPVYAIANKIFSKFGNLGSLVARVFSVYAIANFAKSSIEAASDLVEVQNVVDTAFPNMSAEMDKWASQSIQAFGLSEKSAKEYASTLGLMAQSAGLAEKASYQLGTGLTSVIADMASIYNADFVDVYNAIRSGVIGGRTAAINRFGINMNVANLQAYMTQKGMTQAYSTLDNATKTAIRYNYVIEQTRKIQGDFVKTQGTWANQTRMLKENFTAFKAELGSFLVTALLPIIKWLNNLIGIITVVVGKIKELLGVLGIKFQTAAASSGGSMSELSDDLTDIGDAATDAASKIAKLTDGPFSEMHKLAGDTATGAGGLKDIFGGSSLLTPDSPYGVPKSIYADWFEEIKKSFKVDELFGEIKRWFDEIRRWIKAIKDAWNNAWNIKGNTFVQSIIDKITSIIGLVNDISEAFRQVYQGGWGQKIFETALESATKVNDKVKEVVEKIRTAWNSGSGHIGKVGKDVKPGTHGIPTNVPVSAVTGVEIEERELTWGEYLAEQVYKLTDALIKLKTTVLEWILQKIKEQDWDYIFKTWADSLERIRKAIEGITDALSKNSGDGEEKHGILSFLIAHAIDIAAIAGIIKTLSSVFKIFGGAGKIFAGLGKALGGIGKFLTWLGGGSLTTALQFVLALVEAIVGGWSIGTGIGEIFSLLTGNMEDAEMYADANLLYKLFGGKEKVEEFWFDIFDFWKPIGEWAGDLFMTGFEGVCGGWVKPLWELIMLGNENLGEKFETLWFDCFDFWKDPWLNITGQSWVPFWESKGAELKETVDAWGITEFFETIFDFWRDPWQALTGMSWVPFWETKGAELKDAVDSWGITEFFEEIFEFWKDPWSAIFGKTWSQWWTDLAQDAISAIQQIIDKVKDLFSLNTSGFMSGLTQKASNFVSNAASKIGINIPHHAAGAIYAPNRPQLAVLGDHPSQTEYALTEGHLDAIANRMSMAIMRGMAGVNQNSKQPIIVQIGNEEFKDYVVNAVNENNFRRN